MAQVAPAELESGIRQVIPIRRGGPVQTRFGVSQPYEAGPIKDDLEMRISVLEAEIERLRKESVGYVKINLLPNKGLRTPLDIIVETDGEEFIARAIDLPLYGHGQDPVESIQMLKREIESLYDDLINDEDLTEDWRRIKSFLLKRVTR